MTERRDRPERPSVAKEVMQRIQQLGSLKELSPTEFAEESGLAYRLAEEFGGEKLKPTQLRKVFHEFKRIQRDVQRTRTFDRSRLVTLMPILAYGVGRKHLPKEFYDILKLCLGPQKLQDADDFNRAVEFMEAIMAYHKYLNPKGG